MRSPSILVKQFIFHNLRNECAMIKLSITCILLLALSSMTARAGIFEELSFKKIEYAVSSAVSECNLLRLNNLTASEIDALKGIARSESGEVSSVWTCYSNVASKTLPSAYKVYKQSTYYAADMDNEIIEYLGAYAAYIERAGRFSNYSATRFQFETRSQEQEYKRLESKILFKLKIK